MKITFEIVRRPKKRFSVLLRFTMIAAVSSLLLIGTPQAAIADWLVLHGGEVVETLGPWKVESRQLLFTSTRRVYSSLPLAEIDLESSRALTRERSLSQETPPPAPVRAVVLRINDGDVAVYEPAPIEPAALAVSVPTLRSADGIDTRQAQILGQSPVRPIEWRPREVARGVAIEGLVENQSLSFAAGISLQVTVLDREGRVLGSVPATLGAGALPPRGRARFLAELPAVETFLSAQLEVRSTELATRDAGRLQEEGALLLGLELDPEEQR